MKKSVFLAAGLLLCIFSHSTQAQADSSSPSPALPGEFLLYLPLASVGPHLDATLTAVGEETGYPTRYFACGMLNNSTGQALYDSRVDLLVAIQGYLEPDYYPYVFPATTAFSATLPGQPNPFYYSLLLGKASARIDGVYGTHAHAWTDEPVYRQLTIDGYACDGTTLRGTVGNDSNWILVDLRVAAVDLQSCLSGLTSTQANFLPPGGRADFEIPLYGPCVDQQLLVVGQGAFFQ